MVFSNRESTLEFILHCQIGGGFDMHVSDISHSAWFLQTLTLNSTNMQYFAHPVTIIYRIVSYMKQFSDSVGFSSIENKSMCI